MENNKLITALAGAVVVVILIGSLLGPVINDSQGDQVIYKNDIPAGTLCYSDNVGDCTINLNRSSNTITINSLTEIAIPPSSTSHIPIVIADSMTAAIWGLNFELQYTDDTGLKDASVTFGSGGSGCQNEINIVITGNTFSVELENTTYAGDCVNKKVVSSDGPYKLIDFYQDECPDHLFTGSTNITAMFGNDSMIAGINNGKLTLPGNMAIDWSVKGIENIPDSDIKNIPLGQTFLNDTGRGLYVDMTSGDNARKLPVCDILVCDEITVGEGGLAGANVLAVIPIMIIISVIIGILAVIIKNREY